VSRSGASDNSVQAVTARWLGWQRLDEMRVERRAFAHQPQPRAKIVGLSKRMVAFHAELSGEQRRVDRADTERDDRACVTEYSMLKLLGQLSNMLVRRH